ncbi:MAG TPA: efflux RND transporter periplasmic adaptor subunit [Tepidisphaeraceae bacterium]|jgi:Cu(I)/Ag(I) efflux system membrane fusion protein
MNRTSFLTVVGVVFARLRFVAVFLIAALVVGYWDNIKNHVDHWTRPAVAPDALASAAGATIEYYCPMHPEVVRDQSGTCPKCGMELSKRTRGQAVQLPENVLARVQLTPTRVALAGVQTSPVETRALHREIRAAGLIDYDETKLARLSARVAGRADELFVTYTGQAIKRGEPLYSLYSPEVYTAQREYLQARKRVNDLPPDAPNETKMDASAVYNASLQKLVLWGITTEQLDRLDHVFDETGQVPTHLNVTSPIDGIVVKKEIAQGQYLQAGESPYTVADLRSLWLLVKLYERDVPLVSIGDAVTISVDALLGEKFSGVVDFKAFAVDSATRTLDARVAVANANLRLRPGMFASAQIEVPVGDWGAEPTSAPAMTGSEASAHFAEALQPYLAAHKLLTEDKPQGVKPLLAEVVKKLEPFRSAGGYDAIAKAVAASNETLESLRQNWKDISSGMIEIGKTVGVPPATPVIKVHRCPMKKAVWLQVGDQTANPYYGSEMYSCGNAVEALPRADAKLSTTRAARKARQQLAVPRSAVIDTGSQTIVYVESAAGIFDMRKVTVGPLSADGFYPVLDGLREQEQVVIHGAFLIDAENRLNPVAAR